MILLFLIIMIFSLLWAGTAISQIILIRFPKIKNRKILYDIQQKLERKTRYLYVAVCFIIIVIMIFNINSNWNTAFIKTIIYSDFGRTITGAFVASVLGIATQLFIGKHNSNIETKKYSSILYNDLDNLVKSNEGIYVLSQKGLHFDRIKPFVDILFDSPFYKFTYDSNWRTYYSYLTAKLPQSFYGILTRFYYDIDLLNEAIQNKNYDMLIQIIQHMFSNSSEDSEPNQSDIKEVMSALYKISRGEKIKYTTYKNIADELIYQKKKKQSYAKIENWLIEAIATPKDERKTFKEYVELKLKEEPKKLQKELSPYIDRLISEVSIESKALWKQMSDETLEGQKKDDIKQ